MTGRVHRKARAGVPAGFFRCEAAGLDWLRAAGALPVAEVVDVGEEHLDLVRLTSVAPTAAAARDLGAGLARLHDAGAEAFGSPPDGWSGDGFFGPLDGPLPMASGRFVRWGDFHASCRVEPLTRDLAAAGIATPDDVAALERVAARLRAGDWDDDDPPARLHGDLWSGNVLWTTDGATLIDPAAHGGHRETDLAMLALFGLPYLDEALDAYQRVHPLTPGWRARVGLHQLYPVGVHALLFGGHYAAQLRGILRGLVG